MWKVGKKWAGIKPSGKRFMVDTRGQALNLVGERNPRATRTKTEPKSNPKRKTVSKLARKKGTRRRKSMTIPLSIVGALAAGLAEPLRIATVDKDPGRALALVGARYSGVDARTSDAHFNLHELTIGLGSLVVGGLVHKLVGGAPLNVNRMLAASGIPFIRV